MRNRYSLIRRIILALILLALILAGFYYYLRATYNTTIERNANYVADSATQTAKRVDDLLISAENSITAIAEMYGRSADLGTADVEMLEELTESTVFDYIGIVDADGMYTDNRGRQADVSDRFYFKDAFMGHSGVDMIKNGRVSGEDLVIFYAPLWQDGRVAGVLTGRYRQEQMRSILATDYFGEPAGTYLCLSDGTVIASSKAEKPDNILDTLNSKDSADKDALKTLTEALKTGSSVSLTYENSYGSGAAYVTKLPHCDWMLLQAFPIKVTGEMLTESKAAATMLLLWLVFLSAAYIVLLLAENYRDRRTLTSEKQQMHDIVESTSRLFSRFVVADLQNNTYTIFSSENLDDNSALPEKGAYSDLCSLWQDRIIDEPADDNGLEKFSVESLREHLTDDTPYLQYENRFMEDGTVHWMQASILCLKRAKGVAASVLIAVQDVTELKEMELRSRSAMEDAYHSAQAANNAKRRFLFDMSHDMRTPLNAIIGMSELLSRDAADPERVLAYSGKIGAAGNQLLSLINEVLDMSKIESGSASLELSPFALSDLLAEVDAVFSPRARGKGQMLTVNCYDVMQDFLIGDKLRLSEILHNLISNAITYTPEGGKISLVVRGLCQVTPGYAHLLFEISDNGIGMSPEFVDKVFAPFTREQNSTASGINGAGLGMTITKSLVDLMGGTITVESTQGIGTTVRLELELRAAYEAGVSGFWQERGITRILVLGPNENICRSICSLMDSTGTEVVYATDISRAEELAGGAGPSVKNGASGLTGPSGNEGTSGTAGPSGFDLILLDGMLPGLDGLESLEFIRNRFGSKPELLLIDNNWLELEEDARRAGADGFLPAPFAMSTLKKAVEECRRVSESELSDGGGSGTGPESRNSDDSGFEADSERKAEDESENPAAGLASELETGHKNSAVGGTSLAGLRLLVAEDNDINSEIILELLGMEGAECERAADGREAVSMIQRSPAGYYDAVLMDIQMPVMNGYEAAEAIRQLPERPDAETIPIIAMTANTFADDVQKSLEAGMNAHLSKPIVIEEVASVIRKLVGRL